MSNHDIQGRPIIRKAGWWVYTVPALAVLFVALHLALHFGPGMLRLAIYYVGPLLVSFLAIVFLITGIVYSLLRRPFISRNRLLAFAGLLFFPVSFMVRSEQQGNFVSAYPSSHTGTVSKVSFRLPLDTPITVGWGGDKASTNYHVSTPEQRWAYDLLVTRAGKSFSGDSTSLSSYLCYGLPVLAPAGGQVIVAADSLPDMAIGDLSETTSTSGNYIVIKVAPGEFLVLCHLKPKSLLVKPGDVVTQGQQIALVGNSGHTSEPHLHIHLQDSEDDFFAEGIPLYFSRYISRGQVVERGMPTGGFTDDLRFAGEIVQALR